MTISKKVREGRLKLGLSQDELASRAKVSLRTIQRIESGQNIPYDHTIKSIASALGEEPTSFLIHKSCLNSLKIKAKLKLKLLNLSILTFVIIPFGNIIFPLLLWWKNRDFDSVNELGRRIINFQILWTLFNCFLIVIVLFIQNLFNPESLFSIILTMGFSYLINIYIVIKSAISIRKENYGILKSSLMLF